MSKVPGGCFAQAVQAAIKKSGKPKKGLDSVSESTANIITNRNYVPRDPKVRELAIELGESPEHFLNLAKEQRRSNESGPKGLMDGIKAPAVQHGDQPVKNHTRKYDWLCRFLEWLYCRNGPKLLKIHGVRFPAVTWPVHDGNFVDANSILEFEKPEHLQSGADAFAIYDHSAVGRRQASGQTVDNKPTFCLRRFEISTKKAKVVGGLVGTYFDAIRTCDALRDEIEDALRGMTPAELPDEDGFRAFLERLPLRRKLAAFCEEAGISPLLSGRGRSAAIAVATLTIFRAQFGKVDKWMAFFAKRSHYVANDADAYHVVPSGMFQPTQDWDFPVEARECENEFDLRPHLYRETLEELFNYKEEVLLGMTGDEVQSHWMRHFFNLELQTAPTGSLAPECLTTGVVVSLLNLRLEICTVLLIKDPAWFSRHHTGLKKVRKFKLSQLEFSQKNEAVARGKRFLWLLTLWEEGRFFSDSEIFDQIKEFSASKITVPGAAALHFGLSAFRSRLAGGTRAY